MTKTYAFGLGFAQVSKNRPCCGRGGNLFGARRLTSKRAIHQALGLVDTYKGLHA